MKMIKEMMLEGRNIMKNILENIEYCNIIWR
jgi:hypothetical protein